MLVVVIMTMPLPLPSVDGQLLRLSLNTYYGGTEEVVYSMICLPCLSQQLSSYITIEGSLTFDNLAREVAVTGSTLKTFSPRDGFIVRIV